MNDFTCIKFSYGSIYFFSRMTALRAFLKHNKLGYFLTMRRALDDVLHSATAAQYLNVISYDTKIIIKVYKLLKRRNNCAKYRLEVLDLRSEDEKEDL